ncbi:MAG: T9SS type A sorting domain-containing protein, partial [Cytophagales bacterium]|nr:T9SS type A sorting domain-containing protein [Cytophaga sp.]
AAGDTVDLYYIDTPCHDCSVPQGKTYIATVFADVSGNWSYTGGVSNLSITATNTQKLTGSTSEFSTCTTLPVRLLSFNAVRAGDQVLLSWMTASEENNDYFSIERSADGIHFERIGTIDGNGNSQQLIRYSFIDTAPLTGINYYRLKQVDYDGASTNSNIKAVNIDLEYHITIYPNPVTTGAGINIQIQGLTSGEPVFITVFNAIGQSVYTTSGNTSEYTVSDHAFAAGVYLFSIRAGDYSHVQKVIIY